MEIPYKGLRISVPDSVYPPAEDSYMLANASYKAGQVLEMGCGCGIVSLCWAKENNATGVDINPDAVGISIENAKGNGISATFLQSDLFSNVKGSFDAILFNPPYLPTRDKEKLEGGINRAYDGGADGRQVLDRFLEEFEKYLKPHGSLFLVQSSLNGLNATKSILASKDFSAVVLQEEKFFFEKLYLIRASK